MLNRGSILSCHFTPSTNEAKMNLGKRGGGEGGRVSLALMKRQWERRMDRYFRSRRAMFWVLGIL